MSQPVISVEHLSKTYHLGQIGTGTFSRDLEVWWAKVRGKPNPMLRIGEKDHGNRDGEELWALRDVSFTVGQGEVLGIIGRNGAGKSTLLKILSRVTAPTSGRIKVKGRIASLLEVGTGFHPELTGRENIYLNGAILGMTKQEVTRKFDEIVNFAEVEKFIDTPVKRYSSGMYVRLAFAVAAHLDPEILVVDEVLAVGDAGFQKKCMGKMNDVAKGGRTVLFVSHNMAAVAQLCKSAIWLYEGQIKSIGASSDIIGSYLSSDFSQKAEREWQLIQDAPGDNLVRLLAVRVIQSGKINAIVDINYSVEIHLEYAVLQEVTNLVTASNIFDSNGNCLFSSADWKPNHQMPGKYTKHLTIPAHFLAEGIFSVLVQLVFYEPHIKSVVYPSVVSFESVDSDHALSVRGPYKGLWPGLLRPRLNWSEEKKC